MKEIEESDKKFKLKKGISLLIFGAVIFIIGYVISDTGKSYTLESFVIMYLIGTPAFLLGLPITINEIFPKFSQRLVLITGLSLIIAYGIFWTYTLISH
jgi:polyferredoxin